ncbi:MAG: hypothetical protein M0Z81_04090 [Deltaproteobacteria bacterium]|jgi:hypothetical protein|nr:hypothetical protein [Deltaproteobacteria bacterium]
MEGSFLVYQDAKQTKQLKTLLKGGANAAAAARHAQAIIDQLVDGGTRDPKLMGRLTRYGEARIKNCVKFDLVRGYRLVGVMRNEKIAFLYVGSHDECDHWIKNNAGLEPVLDKRRNTVVEVKETAAEQTPGESDAGMDEPEPDYYELLLKNLTEQDLMKIFPGLCSRK